MYFCARTASPPAVCVLRPVAPVVKRHHKKSKWAGSAKKNNPTFKALEHFDDFYKNVYGRQWPSIRLALLSPHKDISVVNNFGDFESTIEQLQNAGALCVKTLFELQRKNIQNMEINEKDKDNGIFKLDQAIEYIAHSKEQEDCQLLNQQTESSSDLTTPWRERADANEESDKERGGSSVSLLSGLDQAEIDYHRLIHPENEFSSAALHEFVPATHLKGKEDWVLESEHYSSYNKGGDFPVVIKKEHHLNFPNNLNVYSFERGNISSFPSPKRCCNGVFNYYLMDGSSLLPVLALDILPGDVVLDMCAAPGGKSLLMLQTLFKVSLTCNDVRKSRVNRISSVLQQYLPDDGLDNVVLTDCNGTTIEESMYNKVLVDVPCTTDRHSLHESDNNIFNVSRLRERLKLPELQTELLSNALRLVKRGGTVVYSTCTLSPIQNEGVVHMALRNIWEDTDIQLEVRDLSPALNAAKCLFRFTQEPTLRYGHLVVPFLPCNFGPMYFCKIVRVS